MEKTLRVLGGDEDGHGHTHSHSHVEPSVSSSGHASGVVSSSVDGLRSRGSAKASLDSVDSDATAVEENTKSANSPSKMSAYLNLFGDFVHNM